MGGYPPHSDVVWICYAFGTKLFNWKKVFGITICRECGADKFKIYMICLILAASLKIGKMWIQIQCVKNAENDRKVEVQSSPKLDRYISFKSNCELEAYDSSNISKQESDLSEVCFVYNPYQLKICGSNKLNQSGHETKRFLSLNMHMMHLCLFFVCP